MLCGGMVNCRPGKRFLVNFKLKIAHLVVILVKAILN